MAKFFTPSRLSENIRETPEGYLLCLDVPIARTGWQDYGVGETPLEPDADGIVWVYRDPKEVFRTQTIASFNGKSVTIKHPNDFVDPKNWKMLTHGVAQNVRKGEEKDDDGEEQLLADLLITDDFAIGLVKNGLREVSCGYDAEYEQVKVGEGRQVNIIGNHIALVEQGRAGSAYAIKDHNRKVEEMKILKELAEQIKALTKTVDAAVDADKEAADKLKLKKEAKAKDAKTEDGTPEQVCYDDIKKHIADLGEKVAALAGSKGAGEKMEDDDMMDSDEEQEVGQNSRLDKLEAAVAKILKMLGNKEAQDDDEEEKKEKKDMKDDDGDDDEDMSGAEDDDMESYDEDIMDDDGEEGEEGENSQKKKMGDAAHFEILTPSKKYTGKDARVQCLKAFGKTEDGAKVLKMLGMIKPVFDARTSYDTIFLAASALVKAQRGVGLNGTKDGRKWRAEDVDNTATTGLTAEQLNEMNAKHYATAN